MNENACLKSPWVFPSMSSSNKNCLLRGKTMLFPATNTLNLCCLTRKTKHPLVLPRARPALSARTVNLLLFSKRSLRRKSCPHFYPASDRQPLLPTALQATVLPHFEPPRILLLLHNTFTDTILPRREPLKC